MPESDWDFEVDENYQELEVMPVLSVRQMGEFMRGKMKSKGIGIEELASRAGVGTRFIWELLHGQPRPEIDLINKVLNILGVKPRVLTAYKIKGLSDPQDNEIPGRFQKIGSEIKPGTVDSEGFDWSGFNISKR